MQKSHRIRLNSICLILPLCLAAPASAYFVQYDYTASAEQLVGFEYLTDDAYLYDQAYVEGHYIQPGYSEAGNYASLGFVADIACGLVGAYTTAVGVQMDPYEFYLATARVEHIALHDELTFVVPAGDYPDGLYARLDGRFTGHCSSTVGAGAQVQGNASFGTASYTSGILEVGIADSNNLYVDEEFTLLGTIVYPGTSYSVEVEVEVSVSIGIHRCLNWAVEYNPGGGYVTGSGWNDFGGGLRFTAFEPPEGITWWSASGVFMSCSVDIAETTPERAPLLAQNHPNPFNPTTRIAFDLPRSAVAGLRIFDVEGRLVRTLHAGQRFEAGRHELQWNGRDDAGRALPSGVYLCRLDADGFTQTRRMTLLK